MNQSLMTIIRAFQAEVRRALELFRIHRDLDDIVEWRTHGLDRTGYLDPGRCHHYAFHGVGCALELAPGYVIDWDFGYTGRMDGFDHWRLKCFLEQRGDLQLV